MKEHVDEIVSMKDYEKTERILNATAISLSRILRLGTDYGHEGRVTEAVVVLNSHPPDLYGLRKDHKVLENDEKRSEEIREKIGVNTNPANNLEKENEAGGRLELENNPEVELRYSGIVQIG